MLYLCYQRRTTMKNAFPEIKKQLGFGCMRLPTKNGEIDYQEMCKMVDSFLEQGFNYFDTARPYHGQQSEIAVRECLVKRHPRESFVLTNKLTQGFFKDVDDLDRMFQDQLDACGVQYFDFYLLHAMNNKRFEYFRDNGIFDKAFQWQEQGKIRHVGFSFHDTADVLDKMLTTYPQIEVVQLQINYIDMDDPEVQSAKCLEVAKKHNKPVFVMEPVKGGRLATLTETSKQPLLALNGGSLASYAIRFCASIPQVSAVLSGMSNFEQLADNTSYMKDFVALNDVERQAIDQTCKLLKATPLVGCTACKYCVDGCPKHINIPQWFECLNTFRTYGKTDVWEIGAAKRNGTLASHCIGCGKCEQACPQKLPIRQLLKETAEKCE